MSKLEQVVESLESLAVLGELHGENAFKNRAYANAARHLKKLDRQFDELYRSGEIKNVEGVGKGILDIIDHVMHDREIPALSQLLKDTPAGLFEILKIPGIGPKKVHALWKQLSITSLGELEYACEENRLVTLPGFGKKTQNMIKHAIAEVHDHKGMFRLDQGFRAAQKIIAELGEHKNIEEIQMGGELAAGADTLSMVDLKIITSASSDAIKKILQKVIDDVELENDSTSLFLGTYDGFSLRVEVSEEKPKPTASSKKLVKRSDLLGAFHNHTIASDGVNTIEDMREAAIARKLTYLGISDHSQSAFYASGLKTDELRAQREQILALNQDKRAKHCCLLTGVESDILADGTLDYPDKVLSELDVVIASIHSRLKQDAEQMTKRMVNAAKNPWTTIIGHPTGRLILGRKPSEYDMNAFLEACKKHNTVVELNSNPHRLDLSDIHLAMAKEHGVKIAINADAHDADALDDLEFGIMTARRAGLGPEDVLNCLSLDDILIWLKNRKKNAIRNT